MNILFYMDSSEYGGVRTVTELLGKELSRRDHCVYILIGVRKYYDSKDFIGGYKCIYLPDKNLCSKSNISAYCKFLKENKIDIVINQDGLYERTLLIDKAKQIGIPVISVIHNNPMLEYNYLLKDAICLRNNTNIEKLKRIARILLYPRTKKRFKNYIKSNINRIEQGGSTVCVLSESYIKSVLKLNGRIKRIEAIPNPLVYSETEIKEEKKENIVLFVGRLDNRSKKIQYLFDIWKKIYSAAQGWKLVVIGTGPDEDSLREQARLLHNIEMVGYTNPKPFYEKASILCMTSMFEGFPMVLTEAMQHGCIPIAFNSFPALSDIINDGHDGIIVKPFNKKEYAKKLLLLMQDKNKRTELSENAYQSVKRFELCTIVDKWLKLLTDTIELNENTISHNL